MTQRTVLIIAAVTNVIAVVAFGGGLWWGGGPGIAKPLVIVGTVVIAAASLVILFVVLRGARATMHEPAGLPHDHERLAASSAAPGGRGIPRSRTTIRPSVARRACSPGVAHSTVGPNAQIYTDIGRGWAAPIGVRPRSNGLGEDTLCYNDPSGHGSPPPSVCLPNGAPMPSSATPAVPEVADRVGGSSRTRTWDPLTKRPT